MKVLISHTAVNSQPWLPSVTHLGKWWQIKLPLLGKLHYVMLSWMHPQEEEGQYFVRWEPRWAGGLLCSMAVRGLGGPAGPPELWWWHSHEGWSLAAGPRRRNGWSVDKGISWSGYQLIKIICLRVWWLSQRNRRRGLICGVKALGLAGCGYVVPCWLSPSRYVQGVLPLPKQIFLFFWKPSRKKCK